ncbi:MAG TPA: glycosyltransferase [Burkholderiaceae bacterium]|nr:glycosyltransferase [Burkholderiaceae bacterium]
MRVSILINNYNYGRFVGAAIDSALAQTYPNVQVVVVDDGSTDDSWDVIQRYGQRIEAVRTVNGGQGSAYNEGMARAQGEWVLFLDSDDLLDADTVAACMAVASPGVSKVQYRLRFIDRSGALIGGGVPYLMHDDQDSPDQVQRLIRRFGHYAGPPSSGNMYRRDAIARYFPMETHRWRRAADTLPFLTAPLHGRVASINRELGSYRLHREGNRSTGVFGNINNSMRDVLISEHMRRDVTLEWIERRAGINVPGPFLPLPWSMRARALSWRMFPNDHPWPDDTAIRLLRLQWRSLREWPGYSMFEKIVMLGWLALVVWLPLPLVRKIASTNTSGSIKAFVRRVLGSKAASSSEAT